MTPLQRIQQIPLSTVQTLPAQDGLPDSRHRWSPSERDAVLMALAAERPLLVRGEPGTGKTQLARAAAVCLGWQLQSVVIHPRFEPTDLLYTFDAVRRLADAQVHARRNLKSDAHYWRPGPLWLAFDRSDACTLPAAAALAAQPAPAGDVVLIDEIDKADSDLPNSLLEVLGQRGFRVPGLDNRWVGQPGATPPLVVVTTNEERELPAAFLRRCIVLNLEPEGDYLAWLLARGEAHHGADAPLARQIDAKVLMEAAQRLEADRSAIKDAGLQPPGPAEYLDVLAALLRLAPGDAERQLALLARMARYAFRKHGRVEGHPQIAQSHGPAADASPL